MKRRNKGFTLAEMLIVVAIMGVLIAIATTSISNSLEKSREAVDMSNIRSAMSELAQAAAIGDTSLFKGISLQTAEKESYYQKIVYCNQKVAKWQSGNKDGKIIINNTEITASSYSEVPKYWYVRYYVSGEKEGSFAANVKSNKKNN